jgi:hypothetical protein
MVGFRGHSSAGSTNEGGAVAWNVNAGYNAARGAARGGSAMRKYSYASLMLYLLTALLFASCTTTQLLKSQAEAISGSWINEDSAPRSLTRAEISMRGDVIEVHLWGACTPTDCDWGVESSKVSDTGDEILGLTWDQDFVVRRQTITLLPDGRLEVMTHSVYNDGRASKATTDYFVRK